MRAKNIGCFDCLKTGNVKVTLPGDTELDIVCPRCNGNKSYYVLSPSPGEFSEDTGEFKFPESLPNATQKLNRSDWIDLIVILLALFATAAIVCYFYIFLIKTLVGLKDKL